MVDKIANEVSNLLGRAAAPYAMYSINWSDEDVQVNPQLSATFHGGPLSRQATTAELKMLASQNWHTITTTDLKRRLADVQHLKRFLKVTVSDLYHETISTNIAYFKSNLDDLEVFLSDDLEHDIDMNTFDYTDIDLSVASDIVAHKLAKCLAWKQLLLQLVAATQQLDAALDLIDPSKWTMLYTTLTNCQTEIDDLLGEFLEDEGVPSFDNAPPSVKAYLEFASSITPNTS
ncbi:hypothetical protein CANCADRAFT_29965 [Tortispora caseinolytica NRRL Y-17796]|uniref:Uncharacterized protein n=1 Tax=Tortispora caseinolytica NRRL Y-17796 TaxID=767744 RepID=A0A1E4TII8_9ASCO|nr:hypothetical protein CANCADRAFT_29965 [Tortispora caseinolytica NRRL Y-17796]